MCRSHKTIDLKEPNRSNCFFLFIFKLEDFIVSHQNAKKRTIQIYLINGFKNLQDQYKKSCLSDVDASPRG